MRTAGIVLAAGASERMGSPKALLPYTDGLPLAVCQIQTLRAGGCDPVAVVMGAHIQKIHLELPDDLLVVENPRWAQGRASSLQAGIRAFPEADGFLFLPVDAIGVKARTVRAILAAAEQDPHTVWRPVHRGAKGNLLWIPRAAGRELLRLSASARVDAWARPRARVLEVPDPAILRNVNTPAAWAKVAGVPKKAGGKNPPAGSTD